MPTEYIVVSAVVEKLTQKAALLQLSNEPNARWVPRSVIEDGESLEVDEDFQDVHIAQWFATKEGISD